MQVSIFSGRKTENLKKKEYIVFNYLEKHQTDFSIAATTTTTKFKKKLNTLNISWVALRNTFRIEFLTSIILIHFTVDQLGYDAMN